jgi:hypothetical protein
MIWLHLLRMQLMMVLLLLLNPAAHCLQMYWPPAAPTVTNEDSIDIDSSSNARRFLLINANKRACQLDNS